MKEYNVVRADGQLRHDVCQLVRLAISEDLERSLDWTTVCLVAPERLGTCHIVTRQPGIAAGLAVLPWVIEEYDADIELTLCLSDGEAFPAKAELGTVSGNVRDILTCERVILNLISRLCGIATQASAYVAAIEGTKSRVYDTRKTTPGWRRLEKYAVRCGGGSNHRTGLYDGFLIKDNHLALAGSADEPLSVVEAVNKALLWRGSQVESLTAPEMVEVEVDSLGLLEQVLPIGPDIVLIDNFSIEQIRQAVAMRDRLAPEVELEVSGNVRLDTIATIARTGVERISCGALTHQATSLDIGLDWLG